MLNKSFSSLADSAQAVLERRRRRKLHKQLNAQFKPYLVKEGEYDRHTLAKMCADVNVYQKKFDLVNPFSYYLDFIDFLMKTPGIELRAMENFMDPADDDRLVVGLRHDLDGDVVAGVKAAESLARRNAPGSFYILHTAFYYGRFEDDAFLRYPGLEHYVKRLIGSGQEFGIHQDPLEIYQGHKMDGTQGLKTELAWLRSLGANIKGIVAHNSAPSYGAENFEIIEGMAANDRDHILHRDTDTPLQTTTLKELGLKYEGNFIAPPNQGELHVLDYYIKHPPEGGLRLPAWQSRYFLYNPVFERRYDASLWLLGVDTWVYAVHRKNERLVEYPLSGSDVKSRLESLKGRRVMVNIHPEYVAG